MIREISKYVTEDGKEFASLVEAEKHENREKAEKLEKEEIKLRLHIYKNLYSFLVIKIGIFSLGPVGVLNFLIDNKKEILLLLTNGNLETVYTQRSFTKDGK